MKEGRKKRRERGQLTRRAIRPPKNRIKHTPPTPIERILGVTAIQMPHAPLHPKAPRPIPACVIYFHPQQFIKCIRFKRPYGAREEAGADEEEEVRHDDEEDGERGARGEAVDDEADDEPADEPDYGGDGDGGGGLAEGDAADEDDCFHACRVFVS